MRELDALALKERTDKSSHHHNYIDYYGRTFQELRDSPLHLLEVGLGTTSDPKTHKSSMWLLKNGYKDMSDYQPGASLRMWGGFFTHPAARLDGFDIAEDVMLSQWPTALRTAKYGGFPVSQRMTTILGDSTKPNAAAVVQRAEHAPYDVIIDDGLHTPSANLRTLANLWPLVQHAKTPNTNPLKIKSSSVMKTGTKGKILGGLYILEDTVSYLGRLLHGIDELRRQGKLPELRKISVEVMPASEYSSILVVLERGVVGEKTQFSENWREKWREPPGARAN